MKYVKNSNLMLILGGLLLLAIGLVVGFNISSNEISYQKESNIVNTDKEKEATLTNDDNTITKENEDIINNSKEEISTNSSSQNSISNSQESDNNVTINENKTIDTYSNDDKEVVNTLENTLSKINNSEVTNDFKAEAKGVFISIVDFLFYDGEINGVKFNELTEEGKQEVLKLANKIDTTIENKIPGYKETISNTASKAFQKASEVIKAGANDISNFAKEKLGEENYNSIIDAKDELVYYTKNAITFIGEVGGNLFDSAKDKLDSWYQNFKSE